MSEPITPDENPFHLHNPADAFFKATVGRVDVSREFLQQFLPSALVQLTDWTSFETVGETYLDADLRSRYADLLFRCRIAGLEAFYYVLLEHKSTPEYWTFFNLLDIEVRIWRRHLENANYARGKLPMIIPVVLHQGPANWNFPTQFADFIDVPELSREEVMPNMPRFEHLLIDLSRVDVDQLRGSIMFRLPLLVMKAVRENRLAELLPTLRPLLIELSSGGSTIGLLQAVFRYLMEADAALNVSTIDEIAANLPEDKKESIMTLREYFVEQGRLEGMQAGRQEGLERGLLFGQIGTFRGILGLPEMPVSKLESKSSEELLRMLQELKREVAERLKE